MNLNENKYSRRAVLAGLAAAGVGATLQAKAESVKPKATAFALIGDRFHNSHYIRTALKKTLVKDTGLTIDFTDETDLLSAETLQGYRMLIVFRDNGQWSGGYEDPYGTYVRRNDPKYVSDPPVTDIKGGSDTWIQPHQGKAVRDFVENGGGAFFYHNCGHISLGNEDFRHVEGAIYTGHPAIRPYRVKMTDRNHPITRGVSDFTVTDEQHYVIYDKDPKYVLMRSENLDGLSYTGSRGNQGTSCEAGWAYEYGKGRVVFMAPGHMIANLWNPEYQKLQKNAVKWLLRET
jgi:type 1 glutamine amidotransferase